MKYRRTVEREGEKMRKNKVRNIRLQLEDDGSIKKKVRNILG